MYEDDRGRLKGPQMLGDNVGAEAMRQDRFKARDRTCEVWGVPVAIAFVFFILGYGIFSQLAFILFGMDIISFSSYPVQYIAHDVVEKLSLETVNAYNMAHGTSFTGWYFTYSPDIQWVTISRGDYNPPWVSTLLAAKLMEYDAYRYICMFVAMILSMGMSAMYFFGIPLGYVVSWAKRATGADVFEEEIQVGEYPDMEVNLSERQPTMLLWLYYIMCWCGGLSHFWKLWKAQDNRTSQERAVRIVEGEPVISFKSWKIRIEKMGEATFDFFGKGTKGVLEEVISIPNSLLSTHIMVCAAIGAGKTVLLKWFLRSLISWNRKRIDAGKIGIKVVIHDAKPEFLTYKEIWDPENYPDQTVILSVDDLRSTPYNIFVDLHSREDCMEVGKLLTPSVQGQNADYFSKTVSNILGSALLAILLQARHDPGVATL